MIAQWKDAALDWICDRPLLILRGLTVTFCVAVFCATVLMLDGSWMLAILTVLWGGWTVLAVQSVTWPITSPSSGVGHAMHQDVADDDDPETITFVVPDGVEVVGAYLICAGDGPGPQQKMVPAEERQYDA